MRTGRFVAPPRGVVGPALVSANQSSSPLKDKSGRTSSQTSRNHVDQVGNSHTKASREFAMVGSKVPTEECCPAKKQKEETHSQMLNYLY